MVSPSDVLIFQTPVTVTLTTATKKEKEKKKREKRAGIKAIDYFLIIFLLV